MAIRKPVASLNQRQQDLRSAVVISVHTGDEAYLRKKAYDDARTKGDSIVLWAALQTARDALAKAADALSKHIKEHGCKR